MVVGEGEAVDDSLSGLLFSEWLCARLFHRCQAEPGVGAFFICEYCRVIDVGVVLL